LSIAEGTYKAEKIAIEYAETTAINTAEFIYMALFNGNYGLFDTYLLESYWTY